MAESTDLVFNPDIDGQLKKRMDGMLDKIEKSGDAKAIAAGFRTLVEFSRPKPPQVTRLEGLEAVVSEIGGKPKE